MKHYRLIIGSLFLFFSLNSNAQHIILSAGYSKILSSQLYESDGYEIPKLVYASNTVHLGYEFPVYKFDDNHSVKLSLNAGLGLAFQSGGEGLDEKFQANHIFSFDFPAYALYNYGRLASNDSSKEWTFGAGLGYHYVNMTYSTKSPAVMAEVAYRNYRFRFNYDLLHTIYKDYYHYEGDIFTPAYSRDLKIRQIGIQLVYQFNSFHDNF